MDMSSAAQLFESAPARFAHLLSDVEQFGGGDSGDRPSVFERLAAVLGQELAEKIVEALSEEALDRLDMGLSAAFAEHLATTLAKDAR